MKKLMLLMTILVFNVGMVLAQMKTVSGVVISAADNQPVIGASVRAKSAPTKYGRMTDIDGKFTFQVPANETTLIISYVGMKTQEVKAEKNLKVILKTNQELLDEVVVVGYSSTTKRSFTGSAVTVKSDELQKKSVTNVAQALNGEVPGVNVVNTNGQPGSVADVYVRGVGSVNAGTAPLYVVDNVPFEGDITSINPADIESTTLLKDAAATSIYGARGANGVIVITTKRGRVGKMNISADIKYGINTQFIPRHDVLTSPEEFAEISWSALKMLAMEANNPEQGFPMNDADAGNWANDNLFGKSGFAPKYDLWNHKAGLIDPSTGKVAAGVTRRYTPELWKDEAFQNSNRMEANIQIAGGNEKLRAFTSIGLLDDRGISLNSDFKRVSARTNLNMNPYEWLSTRASLSYSRSETIAAGQSDYSSTNLFTFVDNMPPIYPVFERNEKGEKIPNPYYKGEYLYDYGIGRGYSGNSNGIATAVFDKDNATTNEFVYNFNATINFLTHFKLENTFSGTFRNYFYKERGNMWFGDPGNQHGTIYHYIENRNTYNVLNLLRYNRTINFNHHIDAFVAHEANLYTYTFDQIQKRNLVDPFIDDLTNALFDSSPAKGYTATYRLESYFGQVNYDYSHKYYLSGTIRRDGSSRFLNNRWGTFGSVGLAWVMSSENFLKDNKFIKYLKLKTSYGTLGQQSGISYYSGYDKYKINPLGEDATLAFDEKGNPDLTWEKANMFQLGFEFTLGKFLDGNIDYYYKKSSDLIYDRRVAPSNGYAIYKVNDGELVNTGVDIDLTFHAIKTSNAFLDVKVNGGFLKNKLTKMPLDPSTNKPKYIDIPGVYGRTKDRSLYDYYISEFVGVNPDNGRSQWTAYYVDENGNGKLDVDKKKGINESISSLVQFENEYPDKISSIKQTITENNNYATKFFVGKSALPTLRGAFAMNSGYKGLEFSIQFIYSLGGYGFDNIYQNLMENSQIGNRNWHVDMRNRWMKKGQHTNVPRLNNGLDVGTNATSTRFLTSNSFLNLSNVRLGYNLPSKLIEKLYLKRMNIWISGDNLYLWSARKGYNPSTSLTGASSEYRYSPLSSISMGVRVSF